MALYKAILHSKIHVNWQTKCDYSVKMWSFNYAQIVMGEYFKLVINCRSSNSTNQYMVGQKSRRLRLTVYIFKMSEPICGCVRNKTVLKCAKNHGNWFRRFEDINRRCEHSNVAIYFSGPSCRHKLHITGSNSVFYWIFIRHRKRGATRETLHRHMQPDTIHMGVTLVWNWRDQLLSYIYPWPLPLPLSLPLPFPSFIRNSPLKPARRSGSAVSSPAGSKTEPRPKSNLVLFGLKILQLVEQFYWFSRESTDKNS